LRLKLFYFAACAAAQTESFRKPLRFFARFLSELLRLNKNKKFGNILAAQ